MDLGLGGKVALVTGASQGIGFATAMALAKEGATVIMNGRDPGRLQQVAEHVREASKGQVVGVAADLTRPEECERLVAEAVAAAGDIDILVNNAAAKVPAGNFLQLDDQTWLDGWNQKLQIHIRCARAVWPLMQQKNNGRIINVIGTAAKNPRASYLPVGATNAALANFTKGLADLGAPHNILVTAVAPSGVDTERWRSLLARRAGAEHKSVHELAKEMAATFPLGRMARPEEVGDVICFLASERASYISGSIVYVDGNASRGLSL